MLRQLDKRETNPKDAKHQGISKEKDIKTVVKTTTLLQRCNLAVNVIDSLESSKPLIIGINELVYGCNEIDVSNKDR